MENTDTRSGIEAIKLAVGSVHYKNLSIKDTFFKTIEQLNFYYINFQDKKYLEIALLYIQAYLEMGFPYEVGKDLFDMILENMDTKREVEFPKTFYRSKAIKLNKSQIRSMIKKWPASPHQNMKIEEVVTDILEKVGNREIGIYSYNCAVTNDIYELIINEKEIYFRDLRRGMFYTFAI